MYNHSIVAPSGRMIHIDEDRGSHDTDVAKFERQYGVKVGDQYKIVDEYSEKVERYIYLGNLWSLCICRGEMMYISPSNHPHWYTTDPGDILPEDLSAAILYVAENYDPEIGYEMEA